MSATGGGGEDVTYLLADFAMGVRFADLPGVVVTLAKQCVLDTVGVAIGGAFEPPLRSLHAGLAQLYGPGSATLLGSSVKMPPAGAALVNAAAAHILDFDDVAPAVGHPSAPVLPALLAVVETHGLSGPDTLAAFVAGYEAECRIGAATAPSHYDRGFHSTATIGAFGATVACAHALRLDSAGAASSIGIVSSMAAGLKSSIGTETKCLQVGRAAENGLVAAQLASLGFTGPVDGIGSAYGFASTHTDGFDPSKLLDAMGQRWWIHQQLFKRHAACYFAHAAIDASTTLRSQVALADVEVIKVGVSPVPLSVCTVDRPESGLEGKFSLRYCTALAFVSGTANVDQFTDSAIANADTQALLDRVQVEVDTKMNRYEAKVTVRCKNGTEVSALGFTGRRSWRVDPAEQWPDLTAKFLSLAGPAVGLTPAQRLVDLVMNLESIDDLSEIFELVAVGSTEGRSA